MRRREFMLTFELGVALPNRAAVFICGVPDRGAVKTAAVAADDAGSEHTVPTVAASQGLAPCKLFLDGVPFVRRNDRLMGMLYVVLRYFAFVFLQCFCQKIHGKALLAKDSYFDRNAPPVIKGVQIAFRGVQIPGYAPRSLLSVNLSCHPILSADYDFFRCRIGFPAVRGRKGRDIPISDELNIDYSNITRRCTRHLQQYSYR